MALSIFHARVALRGALFHTDAMQVAGKIPLGMKALPVDLISLSAHKLNGPKDLGATAQIAREEMTQKAARLVNLRSISTRKT